MVAEFSEINDITVATGVIGVSGHLEWLPVESLLVDQRYQRDVSDLQVRRIVRAFDPDAFGVIVISARSDGGMYIVDGQHRIAAVRQMGWGNQRVPCIVYRNLTIEEEAKVFFLPQTTRKYLTPAQRFRARLIAGDQVAIDVKATAESFGYSLNLGTGGSPDPREIDAVASLEHVRRQFGVDHLPITLALIRDVWATTDVKPSGSLIAGVATFIHRYQGLYDRGRLIRTLKGMIPSRMEADGKEINKLLGGRREDGIGRAILRAYNHKLQTNRLPEWDEMKNRR